MNNDEFILKLSKEEKIQIVKEYRKSGLGLNLPNIIIPDGIWIAKFKEYCGNISNCDSNDQIDFAKNIEEILTFEYNNSLEK